MGIYKNNKKFSGIFDKAKNIIFDKTKKNLLKSNNNVQDAIDENSEMINIINNKLSGGVNNSKAKLWTDSEGGNLELISPNGNHMQMDMYNNDYVRIYSGTPSKEIEGTITWSKNLHLNLNDVSNLMPKLIYLESTYISHNGSLQVTIPSGYNWLKIFGWGYKGARFSILVPLTGMAVIPYVKTASEIGFIQLEYSSSVLTVSDTSDASSLMIYRIQAYVSCP